MQNEREWQVFCRDVLRQPALIEDQRFVSNSARSASRKALRALIIGAFASLTRDEVIERLDKARIANAQMNTMADLWAHPQLKARKRWTDVQTQAGTIPALLPPGAAEPQDVCMGAVPSLGQHTDAILAELGFAQQDVEQFRTAQAI